MRNDIEAHCLYYETANDTIALTINTEVGIRYFRLRNEAISSIDPASLPYNLFVKLVKLDMDLFESLVKEKYEETISKYRRVSPERT